MCRLKVSGPFYEDFKAPVATPSALSTAPGKAAKKGGGGYSAEDIQALVQAAVVSVMGSPVGPEQPLVEAGLDSLGEKNPSFGNIVCGLAN